VVGVPVPAGLRQEVAPRHGDGVLADDGPHALTLDDEPEGILGVPVLRGVLSRHEVLDGRPERRGGVGLAVEGGVRQRDGAPLTTATDGDEVTRSVGEVEQGVPAPQVRGCLRLRVRRHEVADLGPQGDEQLFLEAAVEDVELRTRGGLVGGVARRDLYRRHRAARAV
jgi:hypothetical protein